MNSSDDLETEEIWLIEVFQWHGDDGRALTLENLLAMSPLRHDRSRFLAAIARLRQKELIGPCGLHALTGKPTGYCLSATGKTVKTRVDSTAVA